MTTKRVVGFSGGIDSQAAADWVLERYAKEDVILLNSQAGRNEHPLTVEHIRWYSENVHPVIECVPRIKDLGKGRPGSAITKRRAAWDEDDEMDFGDLAEMKGRFPSRKGQFCTEYLKLRPQLRWFRENLQGVDLERYTGVRRDESESRKDTPHRKWDDYFDCVVRNPLVMWTKEECFRFVEARSGQYNPLYKMGFSRVGCAPCVNSGKEDIRAWAIRFPEMIDKVRAWEKQVGRTFFPPMMPPAEKGGSQRFGFVDEVVEWAKTVHGGKQLSLMVLTEEVEAEQGSCSSKYGLCE